jgi:hypothetical protein
LDLVVGKERQAVLGNDEFVTISGVVVQALAIDGIVQV